MRHLLALMLCATALVADASAQARRGSIYDPAQGPRGLISEKTAFRKGDIVTIYMGMVPELAIAIDGAIINLGSGDASDVIVGASGYVGGRLVALLAADGHQLRLASRDPRGIPDPDGPGGFLRTITRPGTGRGHPGSVLPVPQACFAR